MQPAYVCAYVLPPTIIDRGSKKKFAARGGEKKFLLLQKQTLLHMFLGIKEKM